MLKFEASNKIPQPLGWGVCHSDVDIEKKDDILLSDVLTNNFTQISANKIKNECYTLDPRMAVLYKYIMEGAFLGDDGNIVPIWPMTGVFVATK